MFSIHVDPSQIEKMRLEAEYYDPVKLKKLEWIGLWKEKIKTLRSLCEFITDGTHFTPNYVKSGIRFLSATNINCCQIDMIKTNFITKEDHIKLAKGKCNPKAGDILISKNGKVGTAAVFKSCYEPCSLFVSVALLRYRGELDADYVAAFLNSEGGWNQFSRSAKTGVITNLHLEEIKEILVPEADEIIQTYIGNKIRLADRCRNESKNFWNEATQILENSLGYKITAETFQESDKWSISTDEYIAKSYSPSIAWVNSSLIKNPIGAQFFTPKRAKSILMLKNSGIRLDTLSTIAKRETKKISSEESKKRKLNFIGLANIDSTYGFIDFNIDRKEVSGTCAYVKNRQILFSKLRPNLNKITICPEHVHDACASTELLVYTVFKEYDAYFVYFILKSLLTLNQIVDITSGSTHPRIDPGYSDDILIPVVSRKLQQEIGSLVKKSLTLLYLSNNLVSETKADIENMIKGKLKSDHFSSGKIKMTHWADIENEIKG